MNSTEFIKMMVQDIETHQDKEVLSQVVACMEEVLKQHPFHDIDPADKTPEGCYKAMESHASKNKTGNCFCFTPEMAMKFIAEYLGIGGDMSGSSGTSGGIVDLASFL